MIPRQTAAVNVKISCWMQDIKNPFTRLKLYSDMMCVIGAERHVQHVSLVLQLQASVFSNSR